MCLISILPKGTKKNTQEVHEFIKNGFNCNKDGSGFMYKRNGDNKITIDKGYFNLTKLIDSIDSLKLTEDDELVIHHRIGTSGLVSAENTHPFLISDVESEINVADITINKPALVHNGMIFGIQEYMRMNTNFCDTYAFARYFMSNKYVMGLFLNNRNIFKDFADRLLGTDKLCILFPDRDLEKYGYFIEKNGYFHSNDGYCNYTKNVGGINYYNNDDDLNYTPIINLPKIFNYNNEVKRFGDGLPKSESVSEPKINIHKLKNSVFQLTESNFKYFFFKLPGQGDKLYFLEKLDLKTDSQVFKRLDGNTSVYMPQKTELLLNDTITFVPKNAQFTKVIVDYLYLVEKLPDYSKNRLKKTQKILEETIGHSLFHEFEYKPLKTLGYKNNKFYKLTLLLYVDYLKNKSKANTVKATDFIEDAVVTD